MYLGLTAVFRRVAEGYVAFVPELPGANTQGATLKEARANLAEAVRMTLEANRAMADEDLGGADVIRASPIPTTPPVKPAFSSLDSPTAIASSWLPTPSAAMIFG